MILAQHEGTEHMPAAAAEPAIGLLLLAGAAVVLLVIYAFRRTTRRETDAGLPSESPQRAARPRSSADIWWTVGGVVFFLIFCAVFLVSYNDSRSVSRSYKSEVSRGAAGESDSSSFSVEFNSKRDTSESHAESAGEVRHERSAVDDGVLSTEPLPIDRPYMYPIFFIPVGVLLFIIAIYQLVSRRETDIVRRHDEVQRPRHSYGWWIAGGLCFFAFVGAAFLWLMVGVREPPPHGSPHAIGYATVASNRPSPQPPAAANESPDPLPAPSSDVASDAKKPIPAKLDEKKADSKEDVSAAKKSAKPQAPPYWVRAGDYEEQSSDGMFLAVFSAGPYQSKSECSAVLDEKLLSRLQTYLAAKGMHGSKQFLRTKLPELRREYHDDFYTATRQIQVSADGSKRPMYTTYWRVIIPSENSKPKNNQLLISVWREGASRHRLWNIMLLAAVPLGILLISYGAIKIDQHNEGRTRGVLLILALLLAAGLVVLALSFSASGVPARAPTAKPVASLPSAESQTIKL